MERTERPDFEVQATEGDAPWRIVGDAWINEDGSIFIKLGKMMLMLVGREPCE
jgi:hypothetical protein